MLIIRFSRLSGRFEISGTSTKPEHARPGFRPPVDISFVDRLFIVRVDLPGVDAENLSIEATDNEITIAGSIPPNSAGGPCRLMERPSGSFLRTLSFPARISPDKIEVSLLNGVLTLKIPSPDINRDPTRIEIRIEGAD